jgi:histidyl-tRNA synthetase
MNCGGGGFKAQFRRADHSGARFALILGDDEVHAGMVAIKPLREAQSPQITLPQDQAAAWLCAALTPNPSLSRGEGSSLEKTS